MNKNEIRFTERDMANAFDAGYSLCVSHEYPDSSALPYDEWMKDEYNIEVKYHYNLTFNTAIEGRVKTIDLCYAVDDTEAMRAAINYFVNSNIHPAYMAIKKDAQ